MWDNKVKNSVREIATKSMYRTARAALFMPGDECLCVKNALEQGLIDEYTYIIAVERDFSIATKIEDYLGGIFKSFHVHYGELHNLDLRRYPALDYAFLDFKGIVTIECGKWMMRSLINCLRDDATLVLAQRYGPRNSILRHQMNKGLEKYPSFTEIVKEGCGTDDIHIVSIVALFMCIMRETEFKMTDLIKYKGTDFVNSMCVLRVENIVPRKMPIHPKFTDVIRDIEIKFSRDGNDPVETLLLENDAHKIHRIRDSNSEIYIVFDPKIEQVLNKFYTRREALNWSKEND